MFKAVISIGIIASSFFLFTAFVYTDGIPFVSDMLINALPDEFSIEIGKKLRDEVLNKKRMDDNKTDQLNKFAREMGFPKKVKIYVIKSSEVNAFATPGKYIFVHTGLLDKLEDYTELAGLLSHEYVHIEKNHGLRSVGRSLGYEIFSHVFFSKDLKEQLFDKSNMLLNMEYSRQFEKEADLQGLAFLENKKIDPHGMLSLMKKLKKQERPGKQDKKLSTHPLTIDRIEYIEEEIETMDYVPENNRVLEGVFEGVK